MKRLMAFIILSATLVAPNSSDAWVAVASGGYGGACWHGGWGCGGVTTGAGMAAGAAGFTAGAVVVQGGQSVVMVASAPPLVVDPSTPVGTIFYNMPYGAQPAYINGTQYYIANGMYFRAFFGNNGVYYQLVPSLS